MKILIRNGRVMDPARGLDQQADVAIDGGKVLAIGKAPEGFAAEREIDAAGCWVLPGLVDLAVRLREPGHEHEGMLQSEMAASVAGGVTSLAAEQAGGVAFWAHVGGFGAGVVLIKFFERQDRLAAHRAHHWRPRRLR